MFDHDPSNVNVFKQMCTVVACFHVCILYLWIYLCVYISVPSIPLISQSLSISPSSSLPEEVFP